MFIVCGTKNIAKQVENGIEVQRYCPKCREVRLLSEHQNENWFTIFFMPIFKCGKEKSSFLKCSICDTLYYLNPGDVNLTDKSRLLDTDDKIMITCPMCKNKLKIKRFDSETVTIRCKKCTNTFVVKKNYIGY